MSTVTNCNFCGDIIPPDDQGEDLFRDIHIQYSDEGVDSILSRIGLSYSGDFDICFPCIIEGLQGKKLTLKR